MLYDQRAAIANFKQSRDVAGPVDHAESGNAEAVSALADATALRSDDTILIQRIRQELGVFGVCVINARANSRTARR